MSRMGAGDESSPPKPSKAISSAQEAPPPTTPSYSDWSNSMQAYYGHGATPPPFFASTVASPSPYPYMWGGQHPLMPPYGTPVPYPAMYQPGGVYAHPNMPMAPNTGHTNIEVEGKAPNGKDWTAMKKAKGTSGSAVLIGAKAGESGKAGSGSGNDGGSQSDESGSEGSSDGSDENQQGLAAGGKKKSFNQMLADGANAQNSTGKAVVSMPATNLNIGMDLWNASASGARPVQDERELKRQKRKQSNRESARRSRLRKQAECEELQVRVETLNNENLSLRDELQRLSEECGKLTSENNSIKEELSRISGPDGKSNLEAIKKTRGGEGNV